jgi:nucleotide-binding universal stress UspA family protein
MSKILIPVDFSEYTGLAVDYAYDIALKSRADIVLFHSFHDQLYFSDGGFSTGFESNVMVTDEIISDFYKQKQKNIEELKESIVKRAKAEEWDNIRVETVIETGEPDYQIHKFAEKTEPDLIVMVSTGIGKNFLLAGSVARKVMDSGLAPVLAIPKNASFKSIKNIAFMTEFEETDVEVLAKLFKLLKHFDPYVYVVHLNIEGKAPDAMQRMQNLLDDDLLKEYTVQLIAQVIECEKPQRTIESYVKRKKIDLITIVPHKRNLFKQIFTSDLTKTDLFQTNLPLLGIH